MFPRKNRISKQKDFKRIFQKGGFARGKYLDCRAADNRLGLPRFAVIVSSKVSKKAVVRNRVRRRIYALLREFFKDSELNKDIAVLVRQDISKADFAEIRADLKQCLQKLETPKP